MYKEFGISEKIEELSNETGYGEGDTRKRRN